jgi:hypothetical protein
MNRIFPIMLFAVSVLIAGTAAFFSVRGIGLLFAGSFLPVVVMASSLEIGKLFAVSFLYRKWTTMPRMLRLYLSVATLLLIVITSLGIFGFLSDAYQDTRNKVNFYESKITSLSNQNINLKQQIEDGKDVSKDKQTNTNTNIDRYKNIYDEFVSQQNITKQSYTDQLTAMDKAIELLRSEKGGLFSNNKKRIQEMEDQQSPVRAELMDKVNAIDLNIKTEYQNFLQKVDQSQSTQTIDFDAQPRIDQIEKNDAEILSLRGSIHNTDIGSFKFIADAFNIEVDTAVKWFIIMIVVVFDPLAMCLIIGYNVYVYGSVTHVSPHVIPSIAKASSGVRIRPIKR